MSRVPGCGSAGTAGKSSSPSTSSPPTRSASPNSKAGTGCPLGARPVGECTPGCGACCSPIVLAVRPMDIATSNDDALVWMRNNTTPVRYRHGADRYREHIGYKDLSSLVDCDPWDGEARMRSVFFYECDHYDPA